MADKRAYSGTKVSVEKSMAEVTAMLRRRSCTALMWEEAGTRSTLRFRWKSAEGVDLCARFNVDVKLPPKLKWATGKAAADGLERERERMFRVLVHFLKNLFEAVDGGLLTAEEAFLPYLEDGAGVTVAQHIVPRLRLLSYGNTLRALTSGEGHDG